jgi:hypothetical protein
MPNIVEAMTVTPTWNLIKPFFPKTVKKIPLGQAPREMINAIQLNLFKRVFPELRRAIITAANSSIWKNWV